MTSNVIRLPKWLMHEAFVTDYTPAKPHYMVRIYQGLDGAVNNFEGYGNTIAEAAKEARGKREEFLRSSRAGHARQMGKDA